MKSMNAVTVEENDNGDIEISQPSVFTESGIESVIITKEQAAVVVSWLQELLNER